MTEIEETLAELNSIYDMELSAESTDLPALRGQIEHAVVLDDVWNDEEETSDEEAEADVEALLSEVVEDFDRLMEAVESLSGKIDKLRAILTESAEADVEGD